MKTRDEVRTEALGAIRKYKHAGAAISVGVGKTRLGFDHFALVDKKYIREEGRRAKALVVAPVNKIIKGWEEEAEKWGLEDLHDQLTFSTYRSLTKQDLDYDVVYLDECHSLKNSHDPWLKQFKGYIIGLTGTPPNNKYKSEKSQMVNAYCPIKYTYLTNEAVDDKMLNDYSITVHLLPLGQANTHHVKIKNKQGGIAKQWYTSEYENYNYWTDRIRSAFGGQKMKLSIMRMKSMQVYKTKDMYGKKLLDQSKEKCIIFANEQKQADQLCKHSYHANNKNSEQNMEWFENDTISKLSCVLQLAQGANIKGVKHGIILHAYGNNKQAHQRIGRLLRLNPDDKAHVDILCFKDTVDEKWVKDALANLDESKITWYDTTII